MYPVLLLKNLGLLEAGQTALDVGTGDMAIAERLVRNGLSVDAIDVAEPERAVAGVQFQQVSVEDFLLQNTKTYDIVIARHVLHNTTDPLRVIDDLNAIAGTFVFTCFGTDNWLNDERYVCTQDQILARFPADSIRHRSETFQYSPNHAGQIVYWHVHSFVVCKT